jgi:membrane protease YdiL (CAAX protease family)
VDRRVDYRLAVFFLLSLWLWLFALARVVRGLPLLEWEPRRRVPWSWRELIICVAMFILAMAVCQRLAAFWFPAIAHPFAPDDLPPEEQIVMIQVVSCGSVLGLLMSVIVCRMSVGARASDWGWDARRWAKDIALGATAFLMLALPVQLVAALMQELHPTTEDHPFVELLANQDESRYWATIVVAAVVVAPLVEESVFRVLLQGWLERTVERPCPAAEFSEYNQVRPATWREWWLPIIISSFVFALMHAGQGNAPVPLFVLALGLGYLYERTHRIVPGMVVHFLVNLSAMLQLALRS